MSVTVSCPDGAVLSRFSLGQMSEAEIDSLGGHIAQCPECIRTLDTLNQRDTLLEALAVDPMASQGDPTEAVRVVIERLKTRMLAAAESRQAMAPTTTGDAAGGGQEKEPSLEFLSAPEQPDEIGRLGTYRVLKILGQGGMGLVFQAEDMHLKRRVALKVMRPRLAQKPESCERFLREARAAAAIEHDHIVTIHQVSEANGVPFLAMPWLKGMSLEERLQHSPVLPIAEALRLGRQMASGLAAAHARGLIHRDIKPGNIWLETQPDEPGTAATGGRVKILDFGLAKPLEEANDLSDAAGQITQAGAILGTPSYMSPEQARGEPVDARCDLFSLGVVLYRMCTGQLPFQGTTTGAVLMNLAAVQPEAPCNLNPNVPAGLSDLIQQLLAKKQADRPASAREVGQRLLALEQELKDAPVSGPTVPVELQSIPSSRVNASTIEERKPIGSAPKSKRRLLVAAAVLLLLIGGGTFALYQLEFNTPHGTIIVEIDDPKLEARFKDGELKLYGPDDKFLYSIMPSQRHKNVPAGTYKIKITGADGLTLDTEEFTLVKDGKRTVRVLLRPLQEAKGSEIPAQRYKNSLGMEFALVPKGKAWLGGGGSKMGDKQVEFKDDFYLGVYEVTQEEWEKLTGQTPSHFSRTGAGEAVKDIGDAELKRFPVERVSWDDAQSFLERLNKQEKETGWTYRLPKADEWEYACRGGALSDKLDSAFAFYFEKATNQLLPEQANFVPEPGKGLQRTSKVGSYKPNCLGLYDMHGNVGEWCDDAEKGADGASLRVYRTGCWDRGPESSRATNRDAYLPSARHFNLGLRVARVRVGTSDTDRRAAEWVLSIGGSLTVRADGKILKLKKGDRLPAGSFEVNDLSLMHVKEVDDSTIENLKSTPKVALSLRLHDNKKLGDAGLAKLATYPGFADIGNLTLNDTAVTEAGFEQVTKFKALTELHIGASRVSTAALVPLRAMNLHNVTLYECHNLGDEAMAELARFPRLENLTLSYIPITDAGLENLAKCKTLRSLVVKNCAERAIYLKRTPITESGVKKLAAARPDLRIVWDGGVIDPARYTNTLGMEFALVPKGKAWLGGGSGKPGDKELEFKEDFYLGVYEVTQEEWEKVVGANPSFFSRKGGGKDVAKDVTDAELKRFPVESVSWLDTQVFLEELNRRDKQDGWVYRLPTEDEWEYACRGGPAVTRVDHSFDFYLKKPSNQLLPDQANYRQRDGQTQPCKVGTYPPNRLGLHDMHGNVAEWCNDDTTDAKGIRVRPYRGGAHWFPPLQARAAHRQTMAPDATGRNSGLRVARVRVANLPRYKNSLGMEFALVPKGKAWLGGGGGKMGDKPVEFKDDFFLGVYEVTQEEWTKVMEANPSDFTRKGRAQGAVDKIVDAELKRFPVENVSWDDCQVFIAKLNKLTEESGWRYRLPTEEEWEYACRGGPQADRSESAFYFYLERPANSLLSGQANFGLHADELKRPSKVGSFVPNRLGLYDMHGNVREWCADELSLDPKGVPRRASRGGSFNRSPEFSCAKHRYEASPDNRVNSDHGLRVARVRIAPLPPPTFAAAPFDEKQAKAHQDDWAKYLGRKVVEANSLDMKMTLIPPGKFLMGSPENDKQAVNGDYQGKPAEKPQHAVELTRPYVIAAHEVTQEQFQKILGRNPSAFCAKGRKANEATGLDTGKLPVEMVSWYDAIEFCNKLSAKEGKQPYYELTFAVRDKDGGISTADVKELGGAGYRLPTEAEWEHACRAGTQSPYSFEFTFATNKQYGWFGYDSGRPHAVGERKPNAFGLFDMHGNVFEYCYDWLGDYPASAVEDPRGPSSGSDRLVRGGSWNYLTQYSRSAFRQGQKPGSRYETTGFRVVHSAPMAEATSVVADPVRRAAEWVLKDRGPRHRSYLTLIIAGKFVHLTTGDQVPVGPFEVRQISISGLGKGESAVAIDNLTKLPTTDLRIYHSAGIGDEELAALANHRSYQNLKDLVMNTVGVTERGLPHVAKFTKLENLVLGLAPVSAKELAQLRGLPLKGLTMFICKTVDDAAIAEVSAFPGLKRLSLAELPMTDQSLEHLANCKTLESLTFARMKFSEAARKKLVTALPGCKIIWSGTVEPAIADDPDRRAAEFVLSISGAIQVNELPRTLTALADVPSRPFELTGVMLPNGKKVTDDDMANFKGCKDLTLLNLGFTHVSDAGLANFKDCTKLTAIHLAGWGMTDAGLGHFKDCKALSTLSLYDLKISSVGLAHFKDCKKLTMLDLRATALTNASLEPFKDCKDLKVLNLQATGVHPAELAHFRACKKLDYLNLDRTIVNDAGLVHLKDLANLTQLDLTSTRVTDAGLAHLKGLSKLQTLGLKLTKVSADGLKKLAAALPKCKIESDHGTFGPSK